ncbi:MAG: hypothetical protein V3U81_03490, partial [Candidatus Binatia bacterium]
MRKCFLVIVLILLSVALSLIFKQVPGFGAEFTMKCGTPGSPTDSISTMAKWVVKEVRKRTGGRIEGRVFPASQLGNNIQM